MLIAHVCTLHTHTEGSESGRAGLIGGNLGILEGQLFRLQMSLERKRGGGGGNNRDNTHTLALCHVRAHTQHCFVVLATLIHGCTVGCWRCVRWPRNIITPVALDRRERGVWRGNPVFRLLQRRSVLPMGPSSPLIICSLLMLFQTHRVSFFCGTPNEMFERMFTLLFFHIHLS